MESPSLETFSTCLDPFPYELLQGTALGGLGWGISRGSPELSSNPYDSVIQAWTNSQEVCAIVTVHVVQTCNQLCV